MPESGGPPQLIDPHGVKPQASAVGAAKSLAPPRQSPLESTTATRALLVAS